MASGRERSESIYTLLLLAFHRCKPVERRKKKEMGGCGLSHRLFLCSHVLHARTVLMRYA